MKPPLTAPADPKAFCPDCDWKGLDSQVLTAAHPFADGTIDGCPECREINTIRVACEEPDCWNEGDYAVRLGNRTTWRMACGCWEHARLWERGEATP